MKRPNLWILHVEDHFHENLVGHNDKFVSMKLENPLKTKKSLDLMKCRTPYSKNNQTSETSTLNFFKFIFIFIYFYFIFTSP